jgi:predicted N-acyltransferase
MDIEFVSSIHAISSAEWNGLCTTDYPFIRHEFFAALEDSGSTGTDTGWQPHHLLMRVDGQLIGAVPLFIKTHSYGEYIFDWAWADAYQHHGYNYYPKLVNAIPFTPCYGERWLGFEAQVLEERTFEEQDFKKPIDASPVDAVVEALARECVRLGASGWHCLFPRAQLHQRLTQSRLAARAGCQFHWFNQGYHSFDDFVGRMSARKRKNINKERRQVAAQGFHFETKAGAQITAADWDFFYSLYRHTYAKRSGHTGYLTREFFHRLGESLPDNTLLIIARRDAAPVAAAFFLRDQTTLYGRYWGCLAEYDFLHFETCYYQGIDYAIAHKLQRFDGGAQGEHKIQRGFEPVATYSNHWLVHPGFRAAITDFVDAEAQGVNEYMKAACRHLPFKVADPSAD